MWKIHNLLAILLLFINKSTIVRNHDMNKATYKILSLYIQYTLILHVVYNI